MHRCNYLAKFLTEIAFTRQSPKYIATNFLATLMYPFNPRSKLRKFLLDAFVATIQVVDAID